MKILKKVGAWLWENLPLLFVAAAALLCFFSGDTEGLRFFIILGLFFVIMKDLSEVKARQAGHNAGLMVVASFIDRKLDAKKPRMKYTNTDSEGNIIP